MVVEAFLADLEHPRLDDIRRVRAEILAAVPALTESIKWNSPNFLLGGQDRATFRIQPGDAFQVILHRGAKTTGQFRVDAPAGLIRWAGADRGILTVPADGLDAWLEDALPVIVAWVSIP